MHVSKRERMARRADKWWRSAWHVQMLMCAKGLDVGADASRASSRPKPLSKANLLTDGFRVGRVKTQTTKTKPKVGRSDYTEGETK